MEQSRFLEEDFQGFIQELIDTNRFDDGSKEEGIAKLCVDKGFDTLKPKQKFVLENAIGDYLYDDCSRCGLEIPWTEMSAAEDNGGMCSWCQQMSRNDKE